MLPLFAVTWSITLAPPRVAGGIGAVGLDVYEKEPVINEKLLRQEKALMVPHVGTHTVETLAKMEAWAMENVRRAVVGVDLLSPGTKQCNGIGMHVTEPMAHERSIAHCWSTGCLVRCRVKLLKSWIVPPASLLPTNDT